MKKSKKFIGAVFMAAGILACASCGGDGTAADEKSAEETETKKTYGKNDREDETEMDLTKVEYSNDSKDEKVQEILQTILGDNKSPDEIVYNLNFPSSVGDKLLIIKPVETDIISRKGAIAENLSESKDVTVIVDDRTKELYFKFHVLSAAEAAPYKTERIGDELLHNTDNVRGNITLAQTAGDNGEISVKWTCDRPDLITVEASGTNGEIPAGVVTRGEKDEKVKLTAELKSGDYTTTKEFELTLKAKAAPKEYSGYVYTYFRGNIYGNGESQHIHMAVSEDGFYWKALNENEPILKAELGTKGVRDSYLVRSPEGDHFYLIGTDLDANGGNWAEYGGNGSRYIRVWESDDLVNWSDERLILIAPENAACMWAPETTYDETTGEYVVYWATGLKGGDGKKIWYAKTRDFYTFTEPQIYKNTENGVTFIDTSMTEYQGTYYRFTKNENELSILMETSDRVLGEYSLVKTQIAGEFGVEGPAIYKINGEEKWVLYMDGYAGTNSGVGYFPLVAESLEDLKKANFVRMKKGTYEMPPGAKHGSFVPVTKEEYDALLAKWGNN